MDKEAVIYIIQSKNKEMLPFVTTWLELENIMLSELGQAQKVKYCMLSYTWNDIYIYFQSRTYKNR